MYRVVFFIAIHYLYFNLPVLLLVGLVWYCCRPSTNQSIITFILSYISSRQCLAHRLILFDFVPILHTVSFSFVKKLVKRYCRLSWTVDHMTIVRDQMALSWTVSYVQHIPASSHIPLSRHLPNHSLKFCSKIELVVPTDDLLAMLTVNVMSYHVH